MPRACTVSDGGPIAFRLKERRGRGRPAWTVFGGLVLVLIKLLLLLVFMVVGASFALINDSPVTVDLYFIQSQMPLSMLLLLAVGCGILLGGLAGMVYFMRVKKENADLRRKTRLVNEEVKNLRAMPIKGR